jgi:hypothetical protein
MAVTFVAALSWLVFVWGGTAYLVGWHGWSPWWFLLTLLLSEGAKVKVKA